MDRNATAITNRCNELKRFWSPRNEKMKRWYRLIEMIDELKTEKMESFVGNDPRSMFNLILHLLDTDIPHRIKEYDVSDFEIAAASAELSLFLDTVWDNISTDFRRSGPRQSLKRSLIGLMLATGWYSAFSVVADNGEIVVFDLWSPAETYPMWDGEFGLDEVAHITSISVKKAKSMARRNGWNVGRILPSARNVSLQDYWWIEIEDVFPFAHRVWNAVVIDGGLAKFEPTRFRKIPIYTAPVGGLPDTGPLTEGSQLSTTSYNAGAVASGERWKEEIGQSIVATNENIYRTWNKWWTYSLQLLRDTAQPRIFERSRSGKVIVRPEDVFRRGAIFRGGPEDSVDFIGTPPIPLEIRSTQLDLEAMMQRGGVSWSMYGSVSGQMTAYVMSQIAASANQVMKPFKQAIQNLISDINNDWIDDIRERGVKPYGWTLPAGLPDDARISADFEIEIPGDLVQRATVARMLDPDFRLSYNYVIQKLFPEIKSPIEEVAQVRRDVAEQHPTNALIALIQYYRKQAAYLEKIGDSESAKLFDLAAEAALATLVPAQQEGYGAPRSLMGTRTEGQPRYMLPEYPVT